MCKTRISNIIYVIVDNKLSFGYFKQSKISYKELGAMVAVADSILIQYSMSYKMIVIKINALLVVSTYYFVHKILE